MIGLRALTLAAAAIVAGALSTAGLVSATAAPVPQAAHDTSRAALSLAKADADSFLKTYVQPSGQVIRHNDGDDTVSEGQAYALLLSEVAERPATFARIWHWTATHLQQRSGLLAWQASASGRIESTEPASDADLLTAWALGRTTGPGSGAYHAQARRIADAILANEVVKHGPVLLAAGPWATGSPASLDPSYWTPAAFNALARLTGNHEWSELASNATTYTERLIDDGKLLPPDWAHLDGNTVYANPAPNGTAPAVQYGLDAQRLSVWMATSCQPANRKLAGSWWKLLGNQGTQGDEALSPGGAVISAKTSALGYVAAAATATAAGYGSKAASLLSQARASEHSAPDYYSAAWLALGEALLSTDALGGCH